MIELTGNLWDYYGRAIIAITTSGSVTRDGRAVLGWGCARQAAERCAGLADHLGELIRGRGNHVHNLGGGLVSFPVEETAWSVPDQRLIARSAFELRELADLEGWEVIVVPLPGCGGGGLKWPEVREILAAHFDRRFLLINR